MPRRFAIGDIHGAWKALQQVVERSKFNPDEDTLITLGDIVDGWSEVYECIQYLSKVKNIVQVRGNHDEWAVDYLKTGATPGIWTSQGGKGTLRSFMKLTVEQKADVYKFLEQRLPFYTLEKKVFVHGGINPYIPVEKQDRYEMMWDRTLIERVMVLDKKVVRPYETDIKLGELYDEIYIGHTSTWHWSKVPYICCGVHCLDQGVGWDGRLSMIDIDTKEFWQSDAASELYPKGKLGRMHD